MAKTNKKSNQNNDKIVFAFLATFLSIIGFVIALIVKPKNKYVMFYAKQSLVIFVIGTISGIILNFIFWISLMGGLISFALKILIFIIWLLSWIYALSGEKKNIPIVSYWAEKIDL